MWISPGAPSEWSIPGTSKKDQSRQSRTPAGEGCPFRRFCGTTWWRTKPGKSQQGVGIRQRFRQAVQPNTLVERARRAWYAAKLNGLNLHEARHTFASLMIAAGVNAKALSTFMGHSSIAITMDRYGHLFPGSEAEAAALLDNYLANQQIHAEQSARRAGAVVHVGDDGGI